VLRYIRGLFWDRIAPDKGGFGERLLGVIINQVPQAGRESISAELTSQVPGEGIKILGMLPEERGLLSISLGELAEHLRATVLCCPDALDKLVGNVMVGALCVDSGADYFARRGDKVVITRGERPDIQLAALATSTNCLVLTGDVTPLSEVLRWAEEKGVPILSTKQDTLPTVAGAEEALLQARFRQQNKLKTVEEILARYIDLEALYQDLGIS
jgi:hypothetical protein